MFRFLLSQALCCSLLLIPYMGQAQVGSDESNIDYILSRYAKSMGGRAAFEKLISVRISGHVVLDNGTKASLTILKKKPDLIRFTLDNGQVRTVKAYDGQVAWRLIESGKRVEIIELEGQQKEQFIQDAPLFNNLILRDPEVSKLSLGPDVLVANLPCYQIISTYPDGSKSAHYLDKKSLFDLRIIKLDKDGEQTSEFVPSKFEIVDGVLFAFQLREMRDGQVIATITLDSVQTNVGIINTAFSMPEQPRD